MLLLVPKIGASMKFQWLVAAACLPLMLSACGESPSPKIFIAKEIVTMDENSTGEAILVEGEQIVAVGSVADLQLLSPTAQLDRALQDSVIVPGLIDPHIHMILGALIYSRPFIPPWDMHTPDGVVRGVPDKAAFLNRLGAVHQQQTGDGPLIVYGYHNIVHGDLVRQDLDSISTSRPIFVWHYSGHDFYLNSAAIEWADLTPALADEVEGVALDAEGQLTGRIYEHASHYLFKSLAWELLTPGNIGSGFSGFEQMLERAGVTVVAELGYAIFGKTLEDFYHFMEYTKEDRYTLYLVPEYRAFAKKYGDKAVQKILQMASRDAEHGDPIVLPQVKFFSDAAFYSQTMRLTAPGYLAGQSKGTLGLWATEPEMLKAQIKPYWQAGIGLRIHSNGDAAQDVTLQIMRELDSEFTGPDNRFVIEHAGLLRPDHLQSLAGLEGGISAASHYVHYMGEGLCRGDRRARELHHTTEFCCHTVNPDLATF